MTFQMVNSDHRLTECQAQTSRDAGAHHERAAQTRPFGYGNRIDGLK